MRPLDFVHGFTFLRALGGVQSVLQRHLAQDEAWGLRSQVLTYFEPDDPAAPRVRGLGLSRWKNIRQARRRFEPLAARLPQPVVMGYYNFWGVPFFAGLDRAHRRIGVLHSDWPGLAGCLERVRPLMDGVLCISTPLLAAAQRNWPEFGERIVFLPCPIDPPGGDMAKAPLAGRPLVIGFCGRISREQKRVDRFPGLFRRMRAAGLDFRLEFLGDGPQAGWLQRQFAGEPWVVFHGRLTGDPYWRAMRGWDVILFVSDYEGLPLALVEAMSTGAVPVYPRIGCGGGAYVQQAGEEFWYAAGNSEALIRALQHLRQLPEAAVQDLRERCAQAVRPHLGDGYFRTFSGFVRRIHELPRVSREGCARRPFYWADLCPFGVLRRCYVRGIWQGDAA